MKTSIHRSMRRQPLLFSAVIFCSGVLLPRPAAATPLPGAGSADGYELHGNGFLWWQMVSNDTGGARFLSISTAEGNVGRSRSGRPGLPAAGFLPCGELLAYSTPDPTAPEVERHIEGGSFSYSNVVRDAAWIHWADSGFLKRKRLDAPVGQAAETVTRPGAPPFGGPVTADGAFLIRDDKVWFGDGPALRTLTLGADAVMDTVVLLQGQERVARTTVVGDWIYVLTNTGRLLMREPGSPSFSPRLLGLDIVDFAVRVEKMPAPLGNGFVEIPVLYAVENTAGGRIWTWDTLHPTQFLAGGFGPSGTMYSVTLDDSRLFVSSHTAGSGHLLWRAPWGRDRRVRPDQPSWQIMSVPATSTRRAALRTDGRWLYALEGRTPHYFDTNAPAARCDLEAFGMEVVQVTQDLNNSIPLIAGRRAWVRAYARVAEATPPFATGNLVPEARLEVTGGGLPAFTSAPLNSAVIGPSRDIGAMRGDRRLSWLFAVPAEQVRENRDYTFTVNPLASLPETRDAPAGNNARTVRPPAVRKVPTALIFAPLDCTDGCFDPRVRPAETAAILQRAESLLPVSGFLSGQIAGRIRKPVLKICYADFLGIPYPCLSDEAFSMPDDQDWALLWTVMAQTLDVKSLLYLPLWSNATDIHWVGTIPPAAKGFNGKAGMAGRSLDDLLSSFTNFRPLGFPLTTVNLPRSPFGSSSIVRMATSRPLGDNIQDTVHGGYVLAHELGHNYGRFHIRGGCGLSLPDFPWDHLPYPACHYTWPDLSRPDACLGFDGVTLTPVVPAAAGRAPVADLMAYSASRWPSRETYLAMMGSIPDVPAGFRGLAEPGREASPPEPGGEVVALDGEEEEEALLVQGTVDKAFRAASLQPPLHLPAGAYDAAKLRAAVDLATALPADFPLRLQLLDAAGSVLRDSPLVLCPTGESWTAESFPFIQLTPCPPGVRRMRLMDRSAVLAERPFSPSVPVLGTPAVTVNGSLLRVEWTASDADQDALQFTVQWDHTGRGEWRTLAPAAMEPAFAIDTALLPGGAACRVRVLASDGGNTALADSAAFALAGHAPSAVMAGILQGEVLDFGAIRQVEAFCQDAEDGALKDADHLWTLTDRAGNSSTSGQGRGFLLHNPAPGPWRLALTVTDSGGLTGSAAVDFTVAGPRTPAAAEAPVLDGLCVDAAYADSPPLRILIQESAGPRWAVLRLARHGGGKYDTVNSFLGTLDEVAVWNTGLTPAEVMEALALSPDPGNAALLSLWRFDEPAEVTTVSAVSGVFSGTLSGGVERVPSTAPVYRNQ